MKKTMHFEYYRQYQDLKKKLNEAEAWTVKLPDEDPRKDEAERRINAMIEEAAKLYLLIYP